MGNTFEKYFIRCCTDESEQPGTKLDFLKSEIWFRNKYENAKPAEPTSDTGVRYYNSEIR